MQKEDRQIPNAIHARVVALVTFEARLLHTHKPKRCTGSPELCTVEASSSSTTCELFRAGRVTPVATIQSADVISPSFSTRSSLRIAQVAPLSESVPPKLYGGTERVVATLTDELVRQGHDVTLFASGDSRTDATLVAPVPRALRLAKSVDPLAWHLLMVEQVAQRADEFDIIHFHIAPLHFSIARRLSIPHVTTLHGRLDLPEVVTLYGEFNDLPLISVSDAQRVRFPIRIGSAPSITACRTASCSSARAPVDIWHSSAAFRRRNASIAPSRSRKRAAVRSRSRRKSIRPISGTSSSRSSRCWIIRSSSYSGEITEGQKGEFLGGARALLFPIDWPEPFGLVMIESLACGTPVVAIRGGSVPEIIDHGVTGFICDNLDEAIAATRRVHTLDRRACRRAFERRFTATRMAEDNVQLYRRLAADAALYAD